MERRNVEKLRVAVLGGGISGLSLAWRLRELGVTVDIFEAEEIVGGLAGTVRPEDGAYCLDFGPHFFITQKHEIIQRITDLLGDEVIQFERSAQIYFQGRFLEYPLSARNVLFNFPLANAFATVFTYGAAQLRRPFRRGTREQNVQEWATANFGSHLTKVFFRPYTDNFWKLSAQQLSEDTIPTSTHLKFTKSLKLLLTRRVTGQAKSLTERELVLPLRYPTRGYGVDRRIRSRTGGGTGGAHSQRNSREPGGDHGRSKISYRRATRRGGIAAHG